MYVALPLLIISGLGLMFPEVTINRIFGISGLILTDILHITMGFFISVFLIDSYLYLHPWFQAVITVQGHYHRIS